MYKNNESVTVLIAIASGKGILRINDQMYELMEGSVILLPTHSHAALITNLQQPLHAYKLLIRTREQANPLPVGAMMRKSEMASNANIQFFPYESAIVANVEELYIHRLPASEARHVQNQIIFHQIILQLLKQQEFNYAASEQPSMEHSITYLEPL